MRKGLVSLIAGSTLFLMGCGRNELSQKEKELLNESNELVLGEVVDENYFASGLSVVDEKYITGLVSQAYSGPSLTTKDSIYLVKIKTNEGRVISLNVLDDLTPKESVNQVIGKGDKIGFRKGNIWMWSRRDGFGDYKVVAPTPNETGFYKEGDLYVTRLASAVKRL